MEHNSSASAEELEKSALMDIEVVLDTTRKSKNLKGTSQRAIREAAERVRLAIEGLASRSSSEETRRLHLLNERLRKEVDALRQEMVALREEVVGLRVRPEGPPQVEPQPSRCSSAPEKSHQQGPPMSEMQVHAIVSQIGNMIDARFAGIEDRLLPARTVRPPLAADRRNAAAAVSVAGGAGNRLPFAAPQVSPQVQREAPRSGSGPVTTTRVPDADPSASTSEGWQTVVRRKRNGKKKKNKGTSPSSPQNAAVVPAAQGNKRSRPKRGKNAKRGLRAPRSAAVVLTLQPEAVERGVTYAAVLTKARQAVNLEELGITDVRFRQALTGARMLEFPGAEGTAGADRVAEKLRAVFAEEVRVSRPTKCAELRISGFDDSVTGQDVQDAIARKTGCSPDAVRVGPIRPSPGGARSVWTQCPVAVAKHLADTGRLLVGWGSARVVVLDARPMRCYMCWGLGHVSRKCDSGVDLSKHCFRCGVPGHLASACSANPHCLLCAAAGRPANHAAGRKDCKPPVRSTKESTTSSAAQSEEPSQGAIMVTD